MKLLVGVQKISYSTVELDVDITADMNRLTKRRRIQKALRQYIDDGNEIVWDETYESEPAYNGVAMEKTWGEDNDQ